MQIGRLEFGIVNGSWTLFHAEKGSPKHPE
jgi:hypothetical protein